MLIPSILSTSKKEVTSSKASIIFMALTEKLYIDWQFIILLLSEPLLYP